MSEFSIKVILVALAALAPGCAKHDAPQTHPATPTKPLKRSSVQITVAPAQCQVCRFKSVSFAAGSSSRMTRVSHDHAVDMDRRPM